MDMKRNNALNWISNRLNLRLLILSLIISHFSSVLAQQKWYSKFGWWGVDIGYDVIETLDGHYMVTGYTGSFTNGNSDVLIAKVNQQGWLMWAKNIGGINNDIGKSIVRTIDSGFVIAGYTNTYGNGGYDGYLIKINKVGDMVWQKTFGGNDWDVFTTVITTNDNGFVAVGYSYSNSYGGTDAWIVKTDSLGNLEWEKRIGGTNDDEFVSAEQITDGRIVCAGTTYSFNDANGNYFVYKTTVNGDSLFFREFGTTNKVDIAHDCFVRPGDDAIIVAGETASPFNTDTTYYHFIIMDSLASSVIGQHSFTNGLLKRQYFVTNAYYKNTMHYEVMNDPKYGQGKMEGNFFIFSDIWFTASNTYGSSEDDIIYSCKKTADNGLICVGYTMGFYALQEDVFIVKMDSSLLYSTNVVGVPSFGSNQTTYSVYPTITNDYVTIKNPDHQPTTLTLYTLTGEVVMNKTFQEQSTTIDISDLSEGMYFISLENGAERTIYKIIRSKY